MMQETSANMAFPATYRAACPTCQSANVRPSQRTSRFDFLDAWINRQKYRCRDCRHSFYVRLTPAERAQLHASESNRKKRARGWRGSMQSRSHRRIIEAFLFLSMLIVFYVVFNSLVSKDGTGLFSHQDSEAQP
jgi:transposase-like protein